jgi:hypothetical protein
MLSENRHGRRRAGVLGAPGLTQEEVARTPETTKQSTPAEGDPLLSSSDRRAYLGHISEMTAWRWEQLFGLPGPDLVIGRRRFWRRSTLDTWVDLQAAAKQVPAEAAL